MLLRSLGCLRPAASVPYGTEAARFHVENVHVHHEMRSRFGKGESPFSIKAGSMFIVSIFDLWIAGNRSGRVAALLPTPFEEGLGPFSNTVRRIVCLVLR